MITLSKVETKTLTNLQKLVSDANFFPAWANTRGIALYSQLQMNRWMTVNGSEGSAWQEVSEPYRSRKRRIFGGGARLSGKNKGSVYPSYFGSGNKTLIGTSRLLASVLPPSFRSGPEALNGEEFVKLVDARSLVISTIVPYATYVDEVRPFTAWGSSSKQRFKDDFKAYALAALKRRK